MGQGLHESVIMLDIA